MSAFNQEWLITDRRGAFAMGTPKGIRTRKYHGFFCGIPGRSEASFLADLEIKCNQLDLWPHRYQSPAGPVIYPNPDTLVFEQTPQGPQWSWELQDGKLFFQLEAGSSGGIRLVWRWESSSKKNALLEIRPLFSMRSLHGNGGAPWKLERVDHSLFRVEDESGQLEVHACVEGGLDWRPENPVWYNGFHYTEEEIRGYLCDENLYSSGVFQTALGSGTSCALVLAQDPLDLPGPEEIRARAPSDSNGAAVEPRVPALDFVVSRPAGIVAGYPWFGEWGRDTFVSLPGIALAWLQSGDHSPRVREWTYELLHHWGQWIGQTGMLPNLIETGGSHQWESADATLWWCHSIASLWQFSLDETLPFADIESEFGALLDTAIESIQSGRHLFLRENSEGLLEVLEPHATWMDARWDGAAVTPRTGVLPEINALWFQARCLQWVWNHQSEVRKRSNFGKTNNYTEIENLGRAVLRISESDRPNMVFLSSIPLAPTFVLQDWEKMAEHLVVMAENLWTPVGLRTLSPKNPDFRAHCSGTPEQRDRSYHQGPAWGWLGGHFEMARSRLAAQINHRSSEVSTTPVKMFSELILADMPIAGHIPELFDAEPPYAPRGTPAQAWSIACLEEANARKKLKVDAKLTKLLAQVGVTSHAKPAKRDLVKSQI